jgi:hypothetical protein
VSSRRKQKVSVSLTRNSARSLLARIAAGKRERTREAKEIRRLPQWFRELLEDQHKWKRVEER